jgi:hypothetical protein
MSDMVAKLQVDQTAESICWPSLVISPSIMVPNPSLQDGQRRLEHLHRHLLEVSEHAVEASPPAPITSEGPLMPNRPQCPITSNRSVFLPIPYHTTARASFFLTNEASHGEKNLTISAPGVMALINAKVKLTTSVDLAPQQLVPKQD